MKLTITTYEHVYNLQEMDLQGFDLSEYISPAFIKEDSITSKGISHSDYRYVILNPIWSSKPLVLVDLWEVFDSKQFYSELEKQWRERTSELIKDFKITELGTHTLFEILWSLDVEDINSYLPSILILLYWSGFAYGIKNLGITPLANKKYFDEQNKEYFYVPEIYRNNQYCFKCGVSLSSNGLFCSKQHYRYFSSPSSLRLGRKASDKSYDFFQKLTLNRKALDKSLIKESLKIFRREIDDSDDLEPSELHGELDEFKQPPNKPFTDSSASLKAYNAYLYGSLLNKNIEGKLVDEKAYGLVFDRTFATKVSQAEICKQLILNFIDKSKIINLTQSPKNPCLVGISDQISKCIYSKQVRTASELSERIKQKSALESEGITIRYPLIYEIFENKSTKLVVK